jgi:DNA-binding response OmpR family regulator
MNHRRILIADPDRTVLKELGNALHEQGYEVRAARDGSRALEKTILSRPDLVLFDAACPLINARKYIQILRSNPRTEHIPVVIMGGSEGDSGGSWGYREALIRKPFNIDEVTSLVASILRKMATAREVREGGQKIAGSLAQIALSDLLQIFHLNKKTGELRLSGRAAEGHVFVREGNVIHAATGRHRGEKALFRLLQWREGNFSFDAGGTTADANIRRGTDLLLLEGARQADEFLRLRAELPPHPVRLEAAPEKALRFEGLHPATQEILRLLEFYQTVDDLVEHARVSDFEACRVIRALLDKGVLRPLDTPSAPVVDEPAPLLPQDQLFELRLRLSGGLPPARPSRARLALLSANGNLLREFAAGLARLPGCEPADMPRALDLGFGLLGTIQLSENLRAEVMLLPADRSLRPLWGPLSAGTCAGIVLRPEGDPAAVYRLDSLAQQLAARGLPVVGVGPERVAQVRAILADALGRVLANRAG